MTTANIKNVQVNTTHTLFVCTTCATVWQGGKPIGESGGIKLLQHLQDLAECWELRNHFAIKQVACMSACNRSCVVAFAAEGKSTYVFGDLPVDGSRAILDCASQYYTKEDGSLPWSERPELLKKGLLAKLPSIGK